jgi:molybdopterin converting factor small subunit
MNPPEEYMNNNLGQLREGESNQEINKQLSSDNSISESNNLDKVREILFGNQVREVEKRFARLEERLVKEFTDVRDETRKRLDALEIYLKKEVDSLTERLKNEQTERNAAVQTLSEEHRNIAISLEKKFAQFDEKTTNSQRDLREQILNQSKSLQDDLRQKYEEILALLEREAQELRRDKIDSSKLAALFTDLAIRLNTQNKS